MPNLLVAPEDDDSDVPLVPLFGPSPAPNKGDQPESEFEMLHIKFNPLKVGFGIVSSWPGTDQTSETDQATLFNFITDRQIEKEKEPR
jgi:hypothetical protein